MRKPHIELYMRLSSDLGLFLERSASMEESLLAFKRHLEDNFDVLAPMTATVDRRDFWIKSGGGEGRSTPIILPQEAHDLLTILSFYESGRRIYKIAEDFGRDLARANLDLPTSIIPEVRETVLIEFPDWATGAFGHSDGTFALSVYVRQEWVPLLDGAPGRLLRLQFPDYDREGRLLATSTFLNVNLVGERNLDELLAHAERLAGRKLPASREAVRYAIASYVYVKSGDPDLRQFKARPLPTTKKEKKLRHFLRETEDESLVDLTLVGYDHKKDRLYHASETTVRGHLRFQPYGEGRSKVKVIWIDPHVRRYDQASASEGNHGREG